MRLLLVEDQKPLAQALQTTLQEAGYAVDLAHDGEQGESDARARDYDLLIIDWMLPRQDGATLIRRLREAGERCPILMLTALSDVEKRVEGLDAGADDYLTKPFALDELLARLRALRRQAERMAGAADSLQTTVGPLHINRRSRKVYWKEAELELRPKEYEVLDMLVRGAGDTVTRKALADAVWESASASDDTINATLSGLRRALADARGNENEEDEAVAIETVRGVGYRLTHDAVTTD